MRDLAACSAKGNEMADENPKTGTSGVKTVKSPKLRYQERVDVGETFADSIRTCIFDGQVMRIEFTVARFDDASLLGIGEGRQVPVCRLVLTRNALLDLVNRIGQLSEQLRATGAKGQATAVRPLAKQ
jgi:hypothetical protein